MSAEPAAIPMHVLLEHQDFVRGLARQLVRDPQQAEDLAQDAWIAALERPPGALSTVRGWFAGTLRHRAANLRREHTRRARREAGAARAEQVVERDAAEQLELESRVVRAVLALREPYRGVVLGRYYQGLDTRTLAARQGIAESSLRSQEARALELLRRELDQSVAGGRAAWCPALIGLIEVRGPAAASGALAIPLTLAAALLVLAGVGWYAFGRPDPEHGATASFALAAHDSAAIPEPAAEPLAQEPPAQRSVEPVRPAFGPTREELEALDTPSLLQLALQTQRALRDVLLTPDMDLLLPYRQRLSDPDFGAARILERDLFGEFSGKDWTGLRDGGAYYSFTSRSNDFDNDPDLKLERGRLDESGWGAIKSVGEWELDDPRLDSEVAPPEWNETDRQHWTFLRSDARVKDRSISPEFDERRQELRRGVEPVPGLTVLVRCIDPDRHDWLVALRILATDEHGCTFVWRKLREWPIGGPRGSRPQPANPLVARLIGEPPSYLAGRSAAELMDFLTRIRAVGATRLLTVPAAWVERYAPADHSATTGVLRLLPYGEFSALVEERRGGSTLSLRAVPEPDWPMLRLAGGGFQYMCCSEASWLADIGSMELEALPTSPARPPDELSEWGRSVWDLLWSARPDESALRSGRIVDRATEQRAQELELHFGGAADLGRTYLGRSVRVDRYDLTFALRTVDRDEYGYTVAWRILRELPAPKRLR